jgi:hypothetical protein
MMYQVAPLLLALALLMPWTGPADPGNRIAAANAADGLAEQALIYHQAALAYVAQNPGATGAISPGSLPSAWTVAIVAACIKSGGVATYVAVPTTVSSSAVASAMGRMWGGYPLVGQAQSNKLTNPFTGASTALPCAVPNGAPVVFSQAGG